jgi:hypothetical protein
MSKYKCRPKGDYAPEGLTDFEEIAQRMGLSVRTIHTECHNAMNKLGMGGMARKDLRKLGIAIQLREEERVSYGQVRAGSAECCKWFVDLWNQ